LSGEENEIVSAYRLRANSFVHKPDTPQQTARLVRRIADYWLDIDLFPKARRVDGPHVGVRPAQPESLNWTPSSATMHQS